MVHDSAETGMIHRTARCILLDIEGTVADVRFVYDVMFPFVRREVAAFLASHWEEDFLRSPLLHIAAESGLNATTDPWLQQQVGRQRAIDNAVDAVNRLMDCDSKTTGLKALQGKIWESGFRSGTLRSELFSDVVPALCQWKEVGLELRIYSSGSILAQQMFFEHTTQGNLKPMFVAHYDTTIGNKKESVSYHRIAEDCKLDPYDILFLSDVAAELIAATEAGMQAVACIRPNNAPLSETYQGATLASFDQLEISLPDV